MIRFYIFVHLKLNFSTYEMSINITRTKKRNEQIIFLFVLYISYVSLLFDRRHVSYLFHVFVYEKNKKKTNSNESYIRTEHFNCCFFIPPVFLIESNELFDVFQVSTYQLDLQSCLSVFKQFNFTIFLSFVSLK